LHTKLGIYVLYISLRKVKLYEYDSNNGYKTGLVFWLEKSRKVIFGRPNETEIGKEH
jgi:hypothetical protein